MKAKFYDLDGTQGCFPHIQSIAISSKYQHGCTVLYERKAKVGCSLLGDCMLAQIYETESSSTDALDLQCDPSDTPSNLQKAFLMRPYLFNCAEGRSQGKLVELTRIRA